MTIFSKIINGEIPAYKLLEDEYTFAFLDINPINLGHALIVPKVEINHFSDVPEPYYSKIFENAKLLSKAIEKSTNCLRVCAWFEGFDVPHAHFHICPFYTKTEFKERSGQSVTPKDLLTIQKKILAFL